MLLQIRYARRRAYIGSPPAQQRAGGLRISKLKVSVLIDGGHLRMTARGAKFRYDENLVEQVAYACVDASDETLTRVLYYDCAKFEGKTKLPVSGKPHEFKGTDHWLKNLAAKDYFAVRRGVLKFRGWKPRHIPVAPVTLTDADFFPDFEQKVWT